MWQNIGDEVIDYVIGVEAVCGSLFHSHLLLTLTAPSHSFTHRNYCFACGLLSMKLTGHGSVADGSPTTMSYKRTYPFVPFYTVLFVFLFNFPSLPLCASVGVNVCVRVYAHASLSTAFFILDCMSDFYRASLRRYISLSSPAHLSLSLCLPPLLMWLFVI